MEISYYTNFVARSVVAERLNRSHREPVILDRIQLSRIFNAAVETVIAKAQSFIKNVDIEMRRWVDTQSACTPGDLTLANC